jgi:hypothetical protein
MRLLLSTGKTEMLNLVCYDYQFIISKDAEKNLLKLSVL